MKSILKRPVGIDLFSGAGGMSLGFEQAGFDVVAAVEIDPIHAAVHKFNFPETEVLAASVASVSGKEIRARAQLGSREVDVVFGGAPCQGFSLIGQRAFDDPRNGLVREFVRIVCELDAKHFVFENVKGLTIGKHRAFLDELIQEFELRGYDVRREWRVLNASHYGLPQDRQRLFLLGSKRGLTIPAYPAELTSKAGRPGSLPSSPTCEDALGDIPDAEEFGSLLRSDWVKTTRWGLPSAYAAELRVIDPKSWRFGYRRTWDPELLTASMRASHSDISRRRFAKTAPGEVEPISRFFKLHPNGVSNTLRAGTDSARGAFTSPRPIHYKWNRCVTVREMARLHGFPDWFRFHETKWHGARQIGNAVPPPLARAVAGEVMKALGIDPEKPSQVLSLGSTDLLSMDMGQASAYWKIAVPIRQRNRSHSAESLQLQIV